MTMFTSQLAGPRDEHDRLARETAFNDLAYAARMELRRQFTKWGEQNHPDGTGPDLFVLGPIDLALNDDIGTYPAAAIAQAAKGVTDAAAREGVVDWSDILLEEVFEALAESDPALLRAELVQVAAVALQWAGAIDRRPPLPQAAATSPEPIIAKPADEAEEEFDEDTMAVWGENEDGTPVDPEARAAAEAAE